MATIDTLTIQFSTTKAKDAVTNIKDMATAVRNLASGLQGIETGKLDSFAQAMGVLKANTPTSGQATNMKNFADGVTQLSNAINGSNLDGFATSLSTIASGAQGLNSRTVRNVSNLVTDLAQVGQEAQAVANTVQNAVNQMPNRPTGGANNDPARAVNGIREYFVGLDKVETKIKGIRGALAKWNITVPTKQFKKLEADIENVRKKHNELREQINASLNAGDYNVGSDKFNKKQAELEALRNEYDRLIQKQKELALSGEGFKINPNFSKAYQGISQAIGGIKQAFGGVSSIVQTANKYIDSFIKKISGLGSASKKAKKDTTSLIDAFKKMGKEITRISKMLKLMITRMALRAVIKEVGNGFKSLALHSQEFDTAMSNLINSSKTLGYSISGMAGELLNALAPVLLKLIELINQVINALNQLFAALRGKSSWNKAKDFIGSWSDSIKAANKNAKELKKTVLGFDELNQLTDKTTSGGDTSGNIVDMFEDVPVDPWFQNLADKIKEWAKKLFEPIKNAWNKVGKWVKEKWKYALDELMKLGSSVARDFWRVWAEPETEQIFKNIFIIIGEIGRAVGNLAKQFRKAWDENETGYKILKAIRDIILIITNHLRQMATATADWAATLDFTPLLTSIANWLESLKPAIDAVMQILEDFYNQVVLKFTKWVLESGLPALIDVFTRFNQEVKWDELREKLRKLWEHLEPFMETVGEGLIIFIERVTTKIKDFINGDKFTAFLEYLEGWMDRVTPEQVADAIEKLVTALIGFKLVAGAISLLGGAATVIGAIVSACKGMAAVASGVSTFASALSGLGGALVPVVVVIAAVVIAMYSFVESYGGFQEALGKLRDSIKEVTDKLKEQAEEVGLIPTDWKQGQSAVEDLRDAFLDLAKALGDCKSVWDALFFVVGTGIENIGIAVIPVLEDFVELVADLTEGIAGMVQAWSGFFDVIVGFFTGDSEKVQQGADKLWDGIKTSTTSGAKAVGDTFEGLGDTFVAPYRIAYERLFEEDLLGKVKGAYDEVGEKEKELGSTSEETSRKVRDSFYTINESGATLAGTRQKIEDTTTAYKSNKEALEEMKKGHDNIVGTFKTHWDVVNKSKDAVKESTDKNKDNMVSNKELMDSMNSLQETMKKLSEKYVGIRTSEEQVVDYKTIFGNSMTDMQKSMEDTSKVADETGKSIVDGIKKPIETATFTKESQEMYKTLFGDMENVLGIHSPAKNMMPIGENIILGVNEGMKDEFDSFDQVFSDFYKNYVTPWFDKNKWSFSGVAEGLKETFKGAKDAIADVWNSVADKVNGEHEIGTKKIKINLPKFASGGFVEDGLFYSNRHELVGEFGNGKTAVANNSMIVSGIERGVYSAVSRAMMSDSGNSKYIVTEINVDGEKLAQAVSRGQNKNNRRYSPSMV